MRIPFFGRRKPEPFTEGQIEYLRRYPVFAERIWIRQWPISCRVRCLTEPGLVRPPCPPRQGEFDQQWEDYGVAFWQRKPLAPLPLPRPNARPDRLGGWRAQQRAGVRRGGDTGANGAGSAGQRLA